MSIAIATLSRVLAPLWWSQSPSEPAPQPATPRFPVHARRHTPLRVTRLAEAQLPRHLAGRMVISGSFDDVCRELERLEALGQDRSH